MRILFLFVAAMLVAGPAAANLCSPAWLANAIGAEARALIRSGADVNRQCNTNGNGPLHLALLNDRVDPDVIQALVDAGADLHAENIHRDNALSLAMDRFERKRGVLPEGSAAYRRERALYESMFDGGEVRDAPAAAAHDQLCDLNWWRSSASRSAVQELLSVPGVDADHVCNFNNDRIIHQPLKRASFVGILPSNVHFGIRALVDAGADLYARNNSGDSAVSLAEIRYDRMTDRIIQAQIKWCRSIRDGGNGRNEIIDQPFLSTITQNGPDTGAYLYIQSVATGQPYDELLNETFLELYRSSYGTLNYYAICPYRGVNVR